MLPTNPLLNATAPAGPHLPVALLRQYAAGTLAPAAQHRVEAHTLACPRCADILAGLLQTPAATTDQALAQLQQRLRQRVQQAAAPARQAAAPHRHRWLAPQLAAAAALLLGLVAGGWWAWQQRQHTPAAMVQQAAAPPRPIAHTSGVAPAASTSSTRAKTLDSLAATPDARQSTLKNLAKSPAKPANPTSHLAEAPSKRPNVGARAAGTPPMPPRIGASPREEPVAAVPSQATPVARTAPDSATPALAKAPAAPLATAAPAREPAARLRATMPPPPALAATPAGGYGALRTYLKKETADFEPETKDGPRRSGRVLVRLHIGADGKIEQAEAVRKLRSDYDAEALRLLQEGPAWVPGITAGRRAAQVVEVPVVFEEPGL